MASGPLNYSTTIPASRTVGECQAILADAGASAVAVMYEDKQPVGLSFRLDTPAGSRDFAMPVNVDGVQRMLAGATVKAHISRSQLTSREHASRVAWRVVKDWLEAQLAIIAAGMASLDEIMLPYMELAPGKTLYAAYLEQNGPSALLPGGSR